MKMMSPFWARGGKRKLTTEWREQDERLRREHWQNHTPAECISYTAWRKLPAKRRRAIEAASYERGT